MLQLQQLSELVNKPANKLLRQQRNVFMVLSENIVISSFGSE